ncbi:MAG: DNA polymerase III subunit delta [Firmicutes bacterium]|nr:DNA polymerase III subunit delta [Bacillota bacterium]
MLYILFGNQSLMINNRLTKLVKERLETVDAFNYVRFDGRETLIQDIIYECTLIPLGYERKAVVVDNAYFLTKGGDKEKLDKEQDYKCLIAYLKTPNEQSDLFLCVENPTIDDKSEIVKIIKQNGTIFELADISKDNWPEYVRRYFEKLETKIDADAVTELVIRVQGDANTFVSEANKLALYTNHVRLEDVLLFIERPLEENAFAISNALIKGKNDVALSIFRDLLVQNEEPVRLISLLSNQFRLMSEALYLYSLGLSNNSIATQLGVNEYRVKLAVDARRSISYEKLLLYLDKLYKLDYNIKSGQMDRFYAFEMFIADF